MLLSLKLSLKQNKGHLVHFGECRLPQMTLNEVEEKRCLKLARTLTMYGSGY